MGLRIPRRVDFLRLAETALGQRWQHERRHGVAKAGAVVPTSPE